MKLRFIGIGAACLMMLASCKKEGCTVRSAVNYDPKAKVSDASCLYGGCTAGNALNFNPDADVDDGTCEYIGQIKIFLRKQLLQDQYVHVYWEKLYKGSLYDLCNDASIDCENSGCQNITLKSLQPGMYYFSAVLRPGTDTLTSGYISVGAETCRTISIE